jgi:hypothetical protein
MCNPRRPKNCHARASDILAVPCPALPYPACPALPCLCCSAVCPSLPALALANDVAGCSSPQACPQLIRHAAQIRLNQGRTYHGTRPRLTTGAQLNIGTGGTRWLPNNQLTIRHCLNSALVIGLKSPPCLDNPASSQQPRRRRHRPRRDGTDSPAAHRVRPEPGIPSLHGATLGAPIKHLSSATE